jgi:hypothetical protein
MVRQHTDDSFSVVKIWLWRHATSFVFQHLVTH